jgi:hypothetical protein
MFFSSMWWVCGSWSDVLGVEVGATKYGDLFILHFTLQVTTRKG